MIEEITTTETVEKHEIVSRVCDCCGRIDNDEQVGMWSDITSFTIAFGYGSRLDGDRIDFDICTDCIEDWISTFTHKPKRMIS